MKNKYSIIGHSILAIALAVSTVSCSKDDSTNQGTELVISKDGLPKATLATINTYFGGTANIKVASQAYTANIYNSIYNVKLNTSFEIDFDDNGVWTEIESENDTPIPESFLIAELPIIFEYCINEFPDNYVMEIEREKFGYTVELNNGTDLIFDRNQNLIGYELDDNDEKIRIPFSQLPIITQKFLAGYYDEFDFITIKKEVDDKEITYKVYLTNGVKIEFDYTGMWTEIDGNDEAPIPNNLIPINIINFLDIEYPTFVVTEIEVNKNGTFSLEIYDSGIDQEIEMEFDQDGNFIGLD